MVALRAMRRVALLAVLACSVVVGRASFSSAVPAVSEVSAPLMSPIVMDATGVGDVNMVAVPADTRTAVERQIEADIVTALNVERTARGLSPLALSENLTRAHRRFNEMVASDPSVVEPACPPSWGSTTSCHSGAPYFDWSKLIDNTAAVPVANRINSAAAAGAMAAASVTTPGLFVAGLIEQDAAHRNAVLSTRIDIASVAVKCLPSGRTYMEWIGWDIGSDLSTVTPAYYTGTDITRHVSSSFGTTCPQPQPPSSSTMAPTTTVSPTVTTTPSTGGSSPVGMVPIAPHRDIDSRVGRGMSRPTAGGGARLVLGSVPAAASAAVVNLTAVDPSGGGFATLYPCSKGLPATSSINFEAGAGAVANQVTVPVEAQTVCLWTSAPADFLVDVAGYMVPGGARWVPASGRVMDTRAAGGRVSGLGQIPFNVPAGASAVSFNLTIDDPAAAGFVTVYPCGQVVPDVSNVNFVPGGATPNHVTVKLGAGVCLSTSTGAQVIVDVTGWWMSSGASFAALSPSRLIDTRATALRLGSPMVPVQLVSARPGSLVINATVDRQADGGWLAVFSCGAGFQGTSTVNFGATGARANAAIVDASSGVCAVSNVATDVILDLTGQLV